MKRTVRIAAKHESLSVSLTMRIEGKADQFSGFTKSEMENRFMKVIDRSPAMTPSDLDGMADAWLTGNQALTSGGVRREAVVRLVRAVAAHVLRWAAERAAARCEGNDNPQMAQYARCIEAQADALAPRKEEAK